MEVAGELLQNLGRFGEYWESSGERHARIVSNERATPQSRGCGCERESDSDAPRRFAREHKLREAKLGGFQTGGFPTFLGKGPDCVADPFGTVPRGCC